MRATALSVKIAAILCFITLGVVLAQENMRPPAGAGQPTGGPPVGPLTVQPQQAPVADAATYRQQISYVIGRQFGGSLRTNDVEVNMQALMAGLNDGFTDAKARWSDAELMAAMERFDAEMQQKGAARKAQMMAKNKQEGEAFLAANKAKEGVQVTPSGLQYKVLKQGTGPSPTAADEVLCHYRGVLLDGTQFDTSLDGPPARFRVGGVIPGWTEALQKMKVGDRWQLFVPTELAYNANPRPDGPIEPGAMLIFEVELLEIVR
jgi:FKBP-type peptidyl-prolyl cis-trans isomerase